MIYVGENKSILCRGDFRPAQLYKGDKKITGYTTTEFSGAGTVTLENCYNDRIYNAKIHRKNLMYSYRTTSSGGNSMSMDGSLMTIDGTNKTGANQVGLGYSSKESVLLKAGKKYMFSVHYISGEVVWNKDSFWIGVRKSSNSWGGVLGVNKANYTKTNKVAVSVEEDTLVSFSAVGYGTFNQLKLGIQLEEGNDVSEYEPYQKYNGYLKVCGEDSDSEPQKVAVENGEIASEIPTISGTTIIETDDGVIISGNYKKQEVK